MDPFDFAGAGFGAMFLMVVGMMAVSAVVLAFHVVAIVDVARSPDADFGPWWDNTKTSWLVGLCVAFVLPFGTVVAVVLWWAKIRTPRKQGRLPERPFWAGPPRPQPPYPPHPGYGYPAGWQPGGYPAPAPGAPGGPTGTGWPGAGAGGEPAAPADPPQ